ncbi:helix-turn-helix domain-containing protein [Parvibaculum sp.]|uniref:TetR/AcrR family transcriptional regulator n=1 Tax=Parvibaculum sp. TaxID=2024848 RepID=UPI00320E15C6
MVHVFSESGEFSPAVAQNRTRKMREILASALDLACEGGLDNLTLHALAERMGRSVAAVYRYYPSKEAVVRELQRLVATHIRLISADTAARIDVWAARQGLNEGARALARLIGAAQTYELFAQEAPAEFGLVTHYLGSARYGLPERDAQAVFEVARETLGMLSADIAAAQATGAITPGDAQERTLMHWGALQGVIQLLKFTRRGGAWGPAESLPDTTMRALLAGWGADAALVGELADAIRMKKLASAERQVRDLLHETETNESEAP